MIEKVLNASFKKPLVTFVLIIAGVVLGALWMQDLRRDVFPDLSAPVFNIIVQNPAMGAEELETGIAIPIEVALAGLPNVKRIRSNSQLGVAQVTIEFEPDANYYQSRQFVAERVAQVAGQLPPGIEPPLVSSLTGRLNEIYEFTVRAAPGSVDLMTLRDLVEFEIKNRLLAVPGVAAVERLGGYLRQFQVQIDPSRMSARGVTLDEVLTALEGSNANASGGVIAEGPMEWTVRAIGRVSDVNGIGNTLVAVRGGTPVRLSDVANIVEAPAVRRGLARQGGAEVVSARVIKQFGSDTVGAAKGIRRALEDAQKSMPKGVTIDSVYDQSVLVDASLGGVTRAILIGAFLVIIVLFTILGDARAALLVTFTLPLSLALAGLLLKPLGIGLNTMTLGGLAIAVGLLVDASIIMTENIVHRMSVRRRQGTRREHAFAAAVEVGRPISFATLIVVAVFVPLFAMTGIEGRMYQPLAAAVIAAVAASLVLALTIVPVSAAFVLKPRAEGKEEDVWLIRKLKAVYAPILDAAMRHAGAVRIGTLLVTVPAIALAFFIGSDFMPRLDEGAFLIQTIAPADASFAEVDRLNKDVESKLQAVPEVAKVVRRTGRAERTEDPMPHTISDVLVVLKPERGRSLDELENSMRESLETIPGLSVLFTTPLGMRIDEGLGGTPADISVRIFGPDLDELARIASRAEAILKPVEGIADLRAEKLTGLPQLRVEVDREAATRLGLTPGEILHSLRVGLTGDDDSEVWIGQKRYDLVVKLKEESRRDLGSIGELMIDTPTGTRVPLAQVAKIEQTFGPGAIRREGGSRRIAVEASVVDRDLASTAEEVRDKLSRQLNLPTGYFFDVGGRVESQARAARSLITAIVVAIVAVFLLLYLALGSVAEALVILATLPDAFVGGILALLIAGETWNVSSLIGLIGLFGIAVQNGLVLVAQTRTLISEGRPFSEALREASIGRVRPKIMTAACAILGLLPLLVLGLHGTEIERPLAIVMIGGLLTSTVFTLLALPTFYQFVHQLQERFQRRRTAAEASEASPEVVA